MKRIIWKVIGAVGLILTGGGVTLLLSTLSALSPSEHGTALNPIASLSLGAIARQEMTTMQVVVPDTAEWQRIRRKWGNPVYLIPLWHRIDKKLFVFQI